MSMLNENWQFLQVSAVLRPPVWRWTGRIPIPSFAVTLFATILVMVPVRMGSNVNLCCTKPRVASSRPWCEWFMGIHRLCNHSFFPRRFHRSLVRLGRSLFQLPQYPHLRLSDHKHHPSHIHLRTDPFHTISKAWVDRSFIGLAPPECPWINLMYTNTNIWFDHADLCNIRIELCLIPIFEC